MTNREIEVECKNLDDLGRGIVRLKDTTIFVPNLLLGERALVKTTYSFGKIKSAEVVKLIKASPFRVQPACPYYPACGGCQLLHLSYDEQLRFKREKVKGLLHKFTKLDFPVSDTIPNPETKRFRNKVQKPIRYDSKHKISAGFYMPNTHKIVPVKDCLIETELSNRITTICLKLFSKYHIEPYDEDRETGIIRHLLIKTSQAYDEALVTLIVTTPTIKGLNAFSKELTEQVKEVKGVMLNINKRHTNVILGEEERKVYGYSRIKDKIFDLDFLISSKSFYQTNPKQIENLYGTAIRLADLKPDDVVLDSYCGTGTIGLSMAKKVKSVTGVEIVKDAVKDAVLNAKINNISNARFINADCTEYLLKTKDKYSVVVLDPPRKGSTIEFINAVKKIGPRKVIYISCDPVTLARDLNYFKDCYDVKEVIPVDMFPNSEHVESVVKLEIKK